MPEERSTNHDDLGPVPWHVEVWVAMLTRPWVASALLGLPLAAGLVVAMPVLTALPGFGALSQHPWPIDFVVSWASSTLTMYVVFFMPRF